MSGLHFIIRAGGRRGVALIIILGGLVLISTLVLAFLSAMGTEYKSSRFYADGASARLLADTAVSLVMGQIKAATKGRSASNGVIAWASQPGMIRTFDDSGNPAAYYKLYSSSSMSGTGKFNTASDAIPASWETDTGIYTDLNEPLLGLYPILNPDALSKVEGFAIDSSSSAVNGKSNKAPMPVRWLYLLQDGTLISPTGSGTKAVISGATATNPIVARIAFWTDDESCKVNINTASEGSFWDTPRALTSYERSNLANYQPARNEFQRYPGHPATTSLDPVFGWKLPVAGANSYSQLLPYYTIAPRVTSGGSQGGTTLASSPITADTDRLYATVDELVFQQNRKSLSDGGVNLDASTIELTRFFLTANSRSPDVNLFNRPRVTIWPISAYDDVSHRTLFDRTIAFCSTIASRAYYFQRQNANSSTVDLPAAAATSGVGRNRALIAYLQQLTAANIPGFGGNFSAKYGSDRDQILAEIFDYIRTTNLSDTNGGTSGFQPFTPATGNPPQGQVMPIVLSSAATAPRGLGRFPTLSEAAFLFIGVADKDNPDDATAIPADKIKVQAAFIPELFVPALGWPAYFGDFKIRVTGLDGLQWKSSDAASMSSMGFPTGAQTIVLNTLSTPSLTRNWGGLLGFRFLLSNNTTYTLTSTTSLMTTSSGAGTFDFSGGDITVEFLSNSDEVEQTITLRFPSGTFPTPKLSSNSVAGVTDDVPRSFRKFSPLKTTTSGTTSRGRFRYSNKDDRQPFAWITSNDVVRSMVLTDGDGRIAAGHRTIVPGDNLYTTFTDYNSSSVMSSHSLIESGGHPFYGAKRGRLVKGAGYLNSTKSSTINDQTATTGLSTSTGDMDVAYDGVALGKHSAYSSGDIPGDWDNGIGDIRDGAYINKPDEGSTYRENASSPPYFSPSNYTQGTDANGTFFSPNRQIPSAVMFGSLPTGVIANKPWQTLLFRPGPSSHPGLGSPVSGPPFTSPPDYLLLDLFHMPVIEPYAISEPLSTAGRVNMNYQIIPFTYITRTTGVRAVLKFSRILAIPYTKAATYKYTGNSTDDNQPDLRLDLDLDETIKGFQQRFDANDLFRSAAEICSLYLVPKGYTLSGFPAQWFDVSSSGKFALTGDNSREKPYADIYPRLTTKSNTYTVHYRVQILTRSKQRLKDNAGEFDTASGDQVSSEYRGATMIERHVDPNDTSLSDAATSSLSDTSADLDSHYRFRILNVKKFTP